MPYLNLFAEGEFFVRGVVGEPERRRWKLFGYATTALFTYSLFAPLYWYRMYQRQRGRPICSERKHELQFEVEEEKKAEPSATDNPDDAQRI